MYVLTVVHSGQHGDGLLGHVHAGKDVCSLGNTGQSLSQQLAGQVVQMQVDVVFVLANSTAFADLHSHGTRHHVSGGQVLGGGSIPLHEALSLRVAENSSFAAAALSDEAASAVDAGGVELHELGVHQRDSGSQGHGRPVTCAKCAGGEQNII